MGRLSPPLPSVFCALLATASGACAKAPSVAGPVIARRSDASQRERLSVTLYDDVGVVREVRAVDLAHGTVALEIADVTALLQPETVRVQGLSSPPAFTVLEQNYRSNLLTPKKLLDAYVGKRVTLHRDDERAIGGDVFAQVVANNDGPVFAANGEIIDGFHGRISFPDAPAWLLAKPTLTVLAASASDRQRLDLSYSTGGIAWSCDYVLVVGAGGTQGDLNGWATLDNHSGATFENAQVQLVAGDAGSASFYDAARDRAAVRLSDLAARVDALKAALTHAAGKHPRLVDAPVFALREPTTLLDGERKQVSLLAVNGIPIAKELAFVDSRLRAPSGNPIPPSNHAAGVYLAFENTEPRGLGLPLPAGVLRVYESDADGAAQIVGEARIAPTPRGERVRVKVGEAFDVLGERSQTSFAFLGACESESEWEVVLRNDRDTAVGLQVVEPVDGEWDVVASTPPVSKRDARSFELHAAVPAHGETKATFRIRVRWC